MCAWCAADLPIVPVLLISYPRRLSFGYQIRFPHPWFHVPIIISIFLNKTNSVVSVETSFSHSAVTYPLVPRVLRSFPLISFHKYHYHFCRINLPQGMMKLNFLNGKFPLRLFWVEVKGAHLFPRVVG